MILPPRGMRQEGVLLLLLNIILHGNNQRIWIMPTGYNWNDLNVFDSSVRWEVPVFVMISGTLST